MPRQTTPVPVGLNQHDFTATYKKYRSRIYSYVCSFGFDADQAADLTQEAFIKVYHNLHRHDPAKGTLISWIYRLTRNMLITHKEKVRAKRTESFSERWDDDKAIEHFTGVHAHCFQPELVEEDRRLYAAIEQLDPRQRDVIELAYFRGFAYEDIAEELAIPMGTVKNRIHMAKQELRRLLLRKPMPKRPDIEPTKSGEATLVRQDKWTVVQPQHPFISSLDQRFTGLFISSKEGRSNA